MFSRSSKCSSFNKVIFSGFVTLIMLAACERHRENSNTQISKQIQFADSLMVAGKRIQGQQVLKKLRREINDQNSMICNYYSYQSLVNFNKPELSNCYADSALAFFDSNDKVKKYPIEYRKALLAKGDACVNNEKYFAALTYYVKGKSVAIIAGCTNGDVDEKIGRIYFDQGNYRIAASYFKERYKRLLACSDNISQEKKFITLQGILNNIGFSYEKAGIMDSALYYYNKDIVLIDNNERNHRAIQQNIDAARAVVYDNLGGLHIKLGKLKEAKCFLVKSLSLNTGNDLDKVTSFIKLAAAYTQTKEPLKAGQALTQGDVLLKRHQNAKPDLRLRLLKTTAEYLFEINQLAKAYACQNSYIRLKDSLDSSRSNLYRMDISREIGNLQKQQELANLKQKEKLSKLYLFGIILVSALSIVIVILVVRNLRKAHTNNRQANIHNERLKQALIELERVNQNYVRIMRVMAHDLRNPLGGISGLTQILLADDDLSEDNRQMLDLINTTSIYSLEMISELLKSGFGDSVPIRKERVDVNALLFESVELLQFKAREKGQSIIFNHGQTPVFIPINNEKIWRLFNNLIVNALKFSYRNGVIEVGLVERPGHVLISVSDRGIGIPEHAKDTVFEMFTPAKREGTNGEQPFGLGLSISKNIVEKHGGKIWFENRNGGGTVFFVLLPDKQD